MLKENSKALSTPTSSIRKPKDGRREGQNIDSQIYDCSTPLLLAEGKKCSAELNQRNSDGVSSLEKQRLLGLILQGVIMDSVIIDSPFTCSYGYNI